MGQASSAAKAGRYHHALPGSTTPLGRALPPGFYRDAPEGVGLHLSHIQEVKPVALGVALLRAFPDACARALLMPEVWSREVAVTPVVRLWAAPHVPVQAPLRGLRTHLTVPSLDAEVESHVRDPELRMRTTGAATINRVAVEVVQWAHRRGAKSVVMPVLLLFSDLNQCHRATVVIDSKAREAYLCCGHAQDPGLAAAVRKALATLLSEAGVTLASADDIEEGHGAPLACAFPDDSLAVAWAHGIAPLAMARRCVDGLSPGPAQDSLSRLREPHAWALAHLIGTWAQSQPGGQTRAVQWLAYRSQEPLLRALMRAMSPETAEAVGRELSVRSKPEVEPVVVMDVAIVAMVRHAEKSHGVPVAALEHTLDPESWTAVPMHDKWELTGDADGTVSHATEMMKQERQVHGHAPGILVFGLSKTLQEAAAGEYARTVPVPLDGVVKWREHLKSVYPHVYDTTDVDDGAREPDAASVAAETGPGPGPPALLGNEEDGAVEAPGMRPKGFVTDVRFLRTNGADEEEEAEEGEEAPMEVVAAATGWMAPLEPREEGSSSDSVPSFALVARLRAPWIQDAGAYAKAFPAAAELAREDEKRMRMTTT